MEEASLDVNFAHYIFIICGTTKLAVCIQTSWVAAKLHEERKGRGEGEEAKSLGCCKLAWFHPARPNFVS